MTTTQSPNYKYSNDESLEMIIHAAKANRECAKERKAFNLCRTTVLGKMIDPNYCLDKAIAQVDCFQKIRFEETPAAKEAFNKALECAKTESNVGFFGKGCKSQLDEYLNA